jgi:hypothetical protein
VATRILDALARLANIGQGDVTRLQGISDEWRLRVGDWRIRFRYDHPTRTPASRYNYLNTYYRRSLTEVASRKVYSRWSGSSTMTTLKSEA